MPADSTYPTFEDLLPPERMVVAGIGQRIEGGGGIPARALSGNALMDSNRLAQSNSAIRRAALAAPSLVTER